MTYTTHSWTMGFLVALSVACGGAQQEGTLEDASCPDEGLMIEGQAYCLLRDPIIETRFSCPADLPHRHPLDQGATLCAPDHGALPQDVVDALLARQLKPEGWMITDTPDPGPSTMPTPSNPPPAVPCAQPDTCDDLVDRPGLALLDQNEIADNLAFALTGSAPDNDLRDAAAQNKLHSRSEIRAQARRLASTRAAATHMRDFWFDYLGLAGLQGATRDASAYPSWSGTTEDALIESALRTVEEQAYVNQTPFVTLMTSNAAIMANAEVAAILGQAAPATPWGAVTMNTTHLGLLRHPGVLAAQSSELRGVPTRRGMQLRRLLCQDVPPPPADVDTTVALVGTVSTREQLETTVEDAACAGCHVLTDPLGFALDHYDAIGQWRADDRGFPIDVTGVFDGSAFNDDDQLLSALVGDTRATTCFVRKLSAALYGQDADDSDITAVHDAFVNAAAGDIQLVIALLLSRDAFLYTPILP